MHRPCNNNPLPRSLNGWGFTLIELLIVVAIIAILAAIAVPNFLEAQVRSKVVRARSDMRAVSVAVEAYCTDYNMYPYGVLEGMGSPPERYNWGFLSPSLTTPLAYITSLPIDPFNFYYIVDQYGNPHRAAAPPNSPSTRFRMATKKLWPGPSPATANQAACDLWFANITKRVPCSKEIPYLLVSPGPDNAEDVLPAYNPLATSSCTYDPSNGTVSTGDLVFGPGISK